MRRIALSLLAAAITQLINPVSACTCGPGQFSMSLQKQFELADVVFQGYPVLARLDQRPLEGCPAKIISQVVIEFRVTKWWKGAGGEKVTVSTGLGGGDCGSDFRIGAPYVVFAGGDMAKGYGTSMCAGNLLADTAGREIKELDELAHSEKP